MGGKRVTRRKWVMWSQHLLPHTFKGHSHTTKHLPFLAPSSLTTTEQDLPALFSEPKGSKACFGNAAQPTQNYSSLLEEQHPASQQPPN